jgi:hypothetical protein
MTITVPVKKSAQLGTKDYNIRGKVVSSFCHLDLNKPIKSKMLQVHKYNEAASSII